MSLKLCNFHPFFYQPNYKDQLTCPPQLAEYTTESIIRGSHGRLLHQFLDAAKWYVAQIEDLGFTGRIDEFFLLPHQHPIQREVTLRFFDYWKEPPFRCSRSNEKFGTVLDFVVGSAMSTPHALEEISSNTFAIHDKIWPADGPNGQNMLRNFFHCMNSWKEEHVSGGFWVTDIYPTGTVMVHLSDIQDPESFSTVYLVKGHADVVGDLVKRLCGGRLPGFCLSTILPL